MLLYRSDEWYQALSHEELQKVINQNKAWIDRLTAQGKARPGHALERKGAIVSGRNGRVLSDGPFAVGCRDARRSHCHRPEQSGSRLRYFS